MSTTRRPKAADGAQDKHRGACHEALAAAWLLKQGYDVFRNVSAHGLVDIMAMKDGEVHKFDVKGDTGSRLSPEQEALNVEILRVLPDGACEIWKRYSRDTVNCHHCSEPIPDHRIKYCSPACRYAATRSRRAEPMAVN